MMFPGRGKDFWEVSGWVPCGQPQVNCGAGHPLIAQGLGTPGQTAPKCALSARK